MRKFLIVLFCVLSWASDGDKSEWYRECVKECSQTHVVEGYLKLFWSVEADCKYKCMREHNKMRKERGLKTVQYHGKWPFKRYFGCQEIASVVFSIGNAWAQYRGYRKVNWRIKNSVMHRYWLGALILNLNGWLWSTVFHARDTKWTERLDYFSAAALVLYALYHTLVSLMALYIKPIADYALCTMFFLFYVLHVRKLLIIFDYGYNMAVIGGVGFLFNLLLIVAYMKGWTKSKFAPICGILFIAAGSLEIFDFEPVMEIFDAHSLWHLATIPIGFVLWRYLAEHAMELPNQINL